MGPSARGARGVMVMFGAEMGLDFNSWSLSTPVQYTKGQGIGEVGGKQDY